MYLLNVGLNPEILLWCEKYDFVLVTDNRRSPPVHLTDHPALGHHILGIFPLNPRMSVGEILEEFVLVTLAPLEDEYRDRISYLPLP